MIAKSEIIFDELEIKENAKKYNADAYSKSLVELFTELILKKDLIDK